ASPIGEAFVFAAVAGARIARDPQQVTARGFILKYPLRAIVAGFSLPAFPPETTRNRSPKAAREAQASAHSRTAFQ
ncbi:hypothetical protein, partial [Luteibacter rhizovicinus]|uniref:hypothetical protein n=1 Tax=Luteibacter rhizovicinus TaxID=242606 RepID=UPI001A9E4A9F